MSTPNEQTDIPPEAPSLGAGNLGFVERDNIFSQANLELFRGTGSDLTTSNVSGVLGNTFSITENGRDISGNNRRVGPAGDRVAQATGGDGVVIPDTRTAALPPSRRPPVLDGQPIIGEPSSRLKEEISESLSLEGLRQNGRQAEVDGNRNLAYVGIVPGDTSIEALARIAPNNTRTKIGRDAEADRIARGYTAPAESLFTYDTNPNNPRDRSSSAEVILNANNPLREPVKRNYEFNIAPGAATGQVLIREFDQTGKPRELTPEPGVSRYGIVNGKVDKTLLVIDGVKRMETAPARPYDGHLQESYGAKILIERPAGPKGENRSLDIYIPLTQRTNR